MSASWASARAISARRCIPPERAPKSAPGERPRREIAFSAATPGPPETTSCTVPERPGGISWGTRATLTPCCRTISPSSGAISPLTTLSRVDFPVPFRPRRQIRSPGSICRLAPSRSGGPPKATRMSRKLNNAMLRAPFHDSHRGLFPAGREEGSAFLHCATYPWRKRFRRVEVTKMRSTIGQTPVRESDKQRFAFRTDADPQDRRKGSNISGDSTHKRREIMKRIAGQFTSSSSTRGCGGGAPRLYRFRKCKPFDRRFGRARHGDRQ